MFFFCVCVRVCFFFISVVLWIASLQTAVRVPSHFGVLKRNFVFGPHLPAGEKAAPLPVSVTSAFTSDRMKTPADMRGSS